MERFRRAVAAVYVAVTALLFGSLYYWERTKDPDTVVDATGIFIFTGLVAFLFGAVIARWWAVAVPLAAFPLAALTAVVGSIDDVYAARADYGSPTVLTWLQAAAVFQYFALPAMAAGVASARLVAAWLHRRERRRAAKISLSEPTR